MPKKLLLVRHAKSDWNDSSLSDFERYLNPRGERDAPEMAKRLLQKGLIPQKIVSSTAVRALSTARIFADIMSINPHDILEEPKIYEAAPHVILSVINSLSNEHDYIAIFGHNPGISTVGTYLCSSGLSMPTCGMAMINFPFDDWKLVSAGTGNLEFYDYPKSGAH